MRAHPCRTGAVFVGPSCQRVTPRPGPDHPVFWAFADTLMTSRGVSRVGLPPARLPVSQASRQLSPPTHALVITLINSVSIDEADTIAPNSHLRHRRIQFELHHLRRRGDARWGAAARVTHHGVTRTSSARGPRFPSPCRATSWSAGCCPMSWRRSSTAQSSG